MKKIALLTAGVLVLIFIALLTTAIVIGFSQVKPTTELINKKLAHEAFAKTLIIPEQIPPPSMDINETIYFWEMVTREDEVIGIRVKYTPAFSKEDSTIKLVMEMPEKGDPSIFTKVLPAIVVDEKSLNSAREPEKADLSQNKEAGYKSLNLSVTPNTQQTVRMEWEFNKNELEQDIQEEYKKLEKYPKPILGFIYSLPGFTLKLFGA